MGQTAPRYGRRSMPAVVRLAVSAILAIGAVFLGLVAMHAAALEQVAPVVSAGASEGSSTHSTLVDGGSATVPASEPGCLVSYSDVDAATGCMAPGVTCTVVVAPEHVVPLAAPPSLHENLASTPPSEETGARPIAGLPFLRPDLTALSISRT